MKEREWPRHLARPKVIVQYWLTMGMILFILVALVVDAIR